MWLGSAGPKTSETGLFRLLSSSARNRAAIGKGAIATIAPPGGGVRRPGPRRRRTGGDSDCTGCGCADRPARCPPRRRRQAAAAVAASSDDGDFTTVQRFDNKVPPAVTAEDAFFEFLFSGSELKYAELKEKAAKQEPLPPFALKGVKITFNVDADYTVVRTRLTHNVVGIVEGSDPKLKDTYVAYGAHYDHVGYREGLPVPAAAGRRRPIPRIGSTTAPTTTGRGRWRSWPSRARSRRGRGRSARCCSSGMPAKRTACSGREYSADYPVVPIEKIVAQLNMDMVGRNRNDDPKQANTVLVVGSDRISTELHNINEDANASLAKPMTMDYEMNDPADTESIYTRSDHYSYASKGIPIIFYFTGLHPDYHRAERQRRQDHLRQDSARRAARVQTGRRVANLDHAPVRDNKGPRVGKTVTGKLK